MECHLLQCVACIVGVWGEMLVFTRPPGEGQQGIDLLFIDVRPSLDGVLDLFDYILVLAAPEQLACMLSILHKRLRYGNA